MALLFSDGDMLTSVDNITATLIDAYGVVAAAQGKITNVTNDYLTEVLRIRVINDVTVQGTLLSSYLNELQTKAIEGESQGHTVAWLSGINYAALMNAAPPQILDNLDFLARQMVSPGTYAGIINWMTTQKQPIHVAFADAFNTFVSNVNNGKYIRTLGTAALVPFTSTGVFPVSTVDATQLINITAITTAVVAVGNAVLAPFAAGFLTPGGGTLEAYAKNTIGSGSYTVTCTYTSIFGVTGLTGTISVTGAATPGTVFTSNFAQPVATITAATVVLGNIGDQIGIRLKPVRGVVV